MKNHFYDEDEDINEQMVDDDDNYLEMLKGLKEPEDNTKRNKKYDFEGSQKYSGTKRNQQPDYDEEEITMDEEDNFVEVKKKPQPKQNKKIVKASKKNISVQAQLQEIDQEDQIIIAKTKDDTKGIQETANALREQFAYWNLLINNRQNLQKVLENAKKLPSRSDEFTSNGIQSLVGNLIGNIQRLMDNRKQLYQAVEGDQDLETDFMENHGQPNNTEIQNLVYEVCSKNKDEIEEDVIKWSQKTTLIGSIQKKQGLTGSLNFGSLLQTPIGQTQKALQNKDKLILKSQLKRSIFRTLGQGPEDLNKTTSSLIYDDTDFYLELLRDSIVAQPAAESGDMMSQATQSYLLQRRAQNQEKKDKDVDRKASKSRKIRYDTHQKMINFMIPLDNNNEIEAREDIVSCLFGGGNQKLQEQTIKQKETKKKSLKKTKKVKTDHEDITLL